MSIGSIHFRAQDADERQITVALGKIQPVADHKQIGDGESDIVGSNFLYAPDLFFQQNANPDPPRLEAAQLRDDAFERPPGVEDVVHQQHIPSLHLQPQFLGENQFARFGVLAIAGDADEIQPQRQRQAPKQVRQKHHRAVQK